MPRRRTDVDTDLNGQCKRCGGRGTVRYRNGVVVACPACGGEGHLSARMATQFENRDRRRHSGYIEPATEQDDGTERAQVSLSTLFLPAGQSDSSQDGPIKVQPITGSSGRQRFKVVSGAAAIAAAVRDGLTTVEVLVDPTTYARQELNDMPATGSNTPV